MAISPRVLTLLDKPYASLALMDKIPKRLNLLQFKTVTNYIALSIGNPMISDADAENYFNGLRGLFGVRGKKIPKIKLITLSKNAVNLANGHPPLSAKNMNKNKCCKDCDNNKPPQKINCGCGEDGTGAYWCRGTKCDDNAQSPYECCHCYGTAGFHDC